MITRMFWVHKALAGALGLYVRPVFLFTVIFIMYIINSVFMMLDYIFFPSLWRKRIRSPIIVVGNPRSGTTFLQRFLVDNGFGMGTRLWKELIPSLTLQLLLKPLVPLLEKVSPARHHAAAAHKTSLTGIEAEDPGLMFRFFDGFFLYGFYLSLSKKDYMDNFDPENRDTSARDFAWHEKVWRRVLVSEKQDRIVAKIFNLSVRCPKFLERFPDAKILYMARDPLSIVPSGMSLVTGVLDGALGFWKRPEEIRTRYLSRLYKGFLHLTMRFVKHYNESEDLRNRIKIVTYDRMMKDFDNLMPEIVEFVGKEMTPELDATIKATAEKQRAYSSSHKYDLAKFGLTEEQIRSDYAPFYETFMQ